MDSSYTLRDQQLMSHATNYFAWQCRLVTRELGRRVVEIGCGIGNFTGMLLDREAVLALDIEPQCVAQVQSRYAAARQLEVLNCDWGGADWDDEVRYRVVDFRADSCVCLNVLEHIEDDREALRRMASVLQPGGVIVLLVPAFPALYGPIDKQLGHYRRYTRESMRQLADASGLEITSARYMNAVGFFGWWANSHIFKREVQSAAQIAVFDRCVVPAMSRLESMVAPPFGQSLIVVLRKP
jgi:2-polyprenyl-3-methyl-5-hydroxy-6-metoxy-1,4-benzoquinol methylase